MIRWIGPLMVLAATALTAHWATLHYAPSVIMDRTLSTLKNRGIAEHAFTTPQRITPQTQAVVRTSPDLYYSLCRYDLREGGAVRIKVAEWQDYQSLSFFDAATNNFTTLRLSQQDATIMLYGPGADVPQGTGESVVSPTERGVVLIRRLAPTQEAFESAQAIAAGDQCERLTAELN